MLNPRITFRAYPGDLTFPASLVNIPSMKTSLTISDDKSNVMAVLVLSHQLQTERDFAKLLKNNFQGSLVSSSTQISKAVKSFFDEDYKLNNVPGDSSYYITLPSWMYGSTKLSVVRNHESVYEGLLANYKTFGDVVHSDRLDLTAWYDVDSSMANRLGYNPAREICTVEFVGGNTAEYQMIESSFIEFVKSGSIGSYYNRYVKGKE